MSSYKTNQCPKIRKDFFGKLPPELTIDILSRLPVRATMSCKCVCKSWLDLIKTLEFAKSHFSKSAPSLAVFFQGKMFSDPIPYKVFEYADDHGPEIVHRCNNDFNFNFPRRICINSSADGLLLLCDPQEIPHNLFICNPVTREYIRIPGPPVPSSSTGWMEFNTFGFGASKMTGLYKVVRIYHDFIQLICHVYTLGTGSWRSIVAPGGPLVYEWISSNAEGVLLNGNLHWLAWDLDQSPRISCFDIETELLSTFNSPHLECYHHGKALSLLRGCLCIYAILWLVIRLTSG